MTQQAKTNDITVMAVKDGQYEPGIYTGYSSITRSYHVSFHDGATGQYLSIDSILFDETTDGYAPERALMLRNASL